MIVGDNYVFVENPKTASSSCRRGFQAVGGNTMFSKHCTLMADPYPDRPYKIVVVRNPFDRIISMWKYNHEHMELNDWLKGRAWEVGTGIDVKRCPQRAWAFRCSVIVKYEELQERWPKLLNTMGLPYTPLPVLNVTKGRMGLPHYRDIIDDEARAIIEDRFYPDFEEFGYSW